ncbi:N-formylglutamate amidohydrolase [Tenacibaculum sp. SG-28]|uniref:N-formylglutamate amidohydrolase n=1 Tax=Tenacibaculum sp. SG-28 TaxID=754426 RepID=UPI000CF42A9C|nr:N-formylglutamate amidohydrolase [Tenacibaculum sp. SG-28]PQJ23306.1 hypothetical protein BSU00_03650 [Tenacibaculum sp. SG-28]
MKRLDIAGILLKIQNQEIFEAVSEDYSFTLKIEKYVPYVCAAIHDGHQFRKDLWDNCLHTDYERWYEEDPATKQMIGGHPIVIGGLDSRFEYDLNRSPDSAIYTDAWGKSLWKSNLSENEINSSLIKHNNFYKVVHTLLETLEKKFGTCVVYDMHSYNWKRWGREVPTWNIGTKNIDKDRYKNIIEAWRSALEKTPLPNAIKSTAKINDTFYGNGYFLKFITSNFNNTLVLATEVAKIYCDELSRVIFPEVTSSIEQYLSHAIKHHADTFYAHHRPNIEK